jgi:hypothetical protein
MRLPNGRGPSRSYWSYRMAVDGSVSLPSTANQLAIESL